MGAGENCRFLFSTLTQLHPSFVLVEECAHLVLAISYNAIEAKLGAKQAATREASPLNSAFRATDRTYVRGASKPCAGEVDSAKAQEIARKSTSRAAPLGRVRASLVRAQTRSTLVCTQSPALQKEFALGLQRCALLIWICPSRSSVSLEAKYLSTATMNFALHVSNFTISNQVLRLKHVNFAYTHSCALKVRPFCKKRGVGCTVRLANRKRRENERGRKKMHCFASNCALFFAT